MNKKQKSTPKAKMLTAVLLILFLGSCAVLIFAVCTGQLSRENNQTPTETTLALETTAKVETTAAATTETETTATEASEPQITFASQYKFESVRDENGEEMDLMVAFGSNFAKGRVEFENDRFFISLPVQSKPDAYGGTYSFLSQTEVELRYDNSDIKTATIKATDDQGVVTEVDVTMSSDFVISCVIA